MGRRGRREGIGLWVLGGRWLAACVAALLVACGVVHGDEIIWSEDLTATLSQAGQSGKPIYVYIYYAPLLACQRTVVDTFQHSEVIRLLQGFECCALEATDQANKDFVARHARALASDPTTNTTAGMFPAHVFLDAGGKVQYRCWGYIPGPGFAIVVERVQELMRLRRLCAQNPDDPRALADLGHLMMTLAQTGDISREEARAVLRKAQARDPQNQARAREDATLDLIILAIPDDPVKAHQDLAKFLKDYPNSQRALEVRYWQAVALYAQATPDAYRKALQLLTPFKTTDRSRPEYHSPWAAPALELEALVRATLDGGALKVREKKKKK